MIRNRTYGQHFFHVFKQQVHQLDFTEAYFICILLVTFLCPLFMLSDLFDVLCLLTPTASLGAFLLALDLSLVLDSYPKSKIQGNILFLGFVQSNTNV